MQLQGSESLTALVNPAVLVWMQDLGKLETLASTRTFIYLLTPTRKDHKNTCHKYPPWRTANVLAPHHLAILDRETWSAECLPPGTLRAAPTPVWSRIKMSPQKWASCPCGPGSSIQSYWTITELPFPSPTWPTRMTLQFSGALFCIIFHWNLSKIERPIFSLLWKKMYQGSENKGKSLWICPLHTVGLIPTSVHAVQPTWNTLPSPSSTHLPKFYSFFKTH